MDAPKRRIFFCGQPLSLSRYEYDILDLLVSQPGRIFSREALMARVWDQPEMSMDRTVDAHINRFLSMARRQITRKSVAAAIIVVAISTLFMFVVFRPIKRLTEYP